MNETGNQTPKQTKKGIGKKLLALVFFLLASFLWLWYQHLPPSTEKFDKLDNASFEIFKTETTTELNNSVDQNLDAFLEEISSMKSIFYTVTDSMHITDNKREEMLKELWQTHINSKMDDVITSRVKILVMDLFEHNNECMQALQKAGIKVEPFERKIRDDLVKSLATEGIRISRAGANDAAINFALANGIGGIAGWSVTLMKGTWYTYLIGIVVDLVVSEVIDNNLSAELKAKIKKELQIAMDKALNGQTGLYAQINAGLEKFHAERAEEVAKAEKI